MRHSVKRITGFSLGKIVELTWFKARRFGQALPLNTLAGEWHRMKLITIGEAARLLSVDPATLRRHETDDGCWVELYGQRIRVHRMSPKPNAQRRFDEGEIHRVLARMSKAR